MPSLKASLGKALRSVDLFPTSNFIRYSGDSDYTTSTGGLTSVVVIVIFIILFASMGLKTVNKQIITSQYYVQNDAEPNQLTVTTSPEGGFMFMVGMPGFDLTNSSYKIFNISLYQEYYSPIFQRINMTSIALAPCTVDHFAFNSQIVSLYYKLNMSQMLCPPLGQQLKVMGKKTSDTYARFRISVERCNDSIDPGCITNAEFVALQASSTEFSIALPMINIKINPSNQVYKEVYLQDRNYATFTSNFGLSAYVDVEEDVIDTDVSIMPYEATESQNVTIIPNLFNNVYYVTSGNKPYAEIVFTKIPQTTVYSRSFNKVDTYFSYVGGLIGTIIGLIFILNAYTEMAYQISIARKLHLQKDGSEIRSSDFNFFYYLASYIYKFFQFFKCPPNWPKTRLFLECCSEIQMQLDITYILRRLNFLDSFASKVVEPHELETIFIRKKTTLEQAKQIRKKHFAPELFQQQLQCPQDKEDLSNVSYAKDLSLAEIQPQSNDKYSSKSVSQDISAYEASMSGQDFQHYKSSLQKVAEDGRRGKIISHRIIGQMDSKLINLMREKSRSIRMEESELIEVKPKPQDMEIFYYEFQDKKEGQNNKGLDQS